MSVQEDIELKAAISRDSPGKEHNVAIPLLITGEVDRAPCPVSMEEPAAVVHHEAYIFKFLKQDRPLPGKTLSLMMLLTLFMVMVLLGWNDGSQGPLIPFLQEYYSINYITMSIVFIVMFVGGMISAFVNVWLTDRLGFGIVVCIGAAAQGLYYLLAALGLPYPVYAFANVFNGFGFGLEDAQVNALTSRLPNATTKMFLLQAFFGIGAAISPIIATSYIKAFPFTAYTYYWICFGVAVFTLTALITVFRFRTDDQVVGRRPLGEGEEAPTKVVSSAEKVRRILKSPVVHVLMLFNFIYVGTEISIGSWATTYLLRVRDGGPNSGYVSVGFWGGLALGRIVLIPVTNKFGHRLCVTVYSALSLGFQILVWTVPNMPACAVFFALTGVFFGPIFPSALMIITEILPHDLHVGTMGLFGSIGGAGGAALPFITGALSDRYGIWVLSPFVVALISASMIMWLFVARVKRQP